MSTKFVHVLVGVDGHVLTFELTFVKLSEIPNRGRTYPSAGISDTVSVGRYPLFGIFHLGCQLDIPGPKKCSCCSGL